jgi:hypothetical protein
LISGSEETMGQRLDTVKRTSNIDFELLA